MKSISTKDLELELKRRKSKPGIYTVLRYLRNERKGRFGAPIFIHLVENEDGEQLEIQLVGNIYDTELNNHEPTCSDEDSNWYSDWEEYGNFSVNYFIGKKVKIDSVYPVKISQIIK